MEIPPPRITFFFLSLLLASCSGNTETGKKKPENQPVPVKTAPVEQKNVPWIIHAMGNAESCLTVAIKAQVDGALVKAHITDGQEVRQDEPLFDLDDQRYRHRLNQLRATLDKDLAQLELARSRERRQTVLNKEKIASEENLAAMVANRRTLEATVTADRAAIAEGEWQQGLTRITAPLSGRAGRILIQPGNLIKANDTNPLVVIHQMDPICITFTVAERHFTDVRQYHAQNPLTLQIIPHQGNRTPLPATLHSLDNTIDRKTATIRLKAQADNPEHRLWPGMFVTLALKLIDRPQALVIPTPAIQTGPDGPFVYVVKNDKTVDLRPITLTQEDQNESIVEKGLAAGETVVTVGQWRLKPGAVVELPGSKDTTDAKKETGKTP
ncbi:MAG: efflux RND transporter periplasmic adaptor subunit [Magnetococcales bacterium]|nr:efflux RND transporter periplasmic adaptor subunit [Magnetococcales bacterium]MBF0149999.1 efflux RND transporter periplasmic adaptor subunit [Magnetococcales bacterium]MBF0174246.1 efflux RND transporter periplasmic adaptor subunit [Magnetococcales bacterium]MBF0347774.1 efflux RND transporter periplasmic adaptor subunit [Magnetococcales bacterium]MBF0631273.1 efflux RND transporter periplasmic adaptor subunit [Magnetococcales bacterium]